jgi:hypothetical protein
VCREILRDDDCVELSKRHVLVLRVCRDQTG